MEPGIFSFIAKYSKKEQILLLVIIGVSFPFLYMSMDLPKTIINKAIGSSAFPQTLFSYELEQIPYLLVLCGLFLALVMINGLFKLWVNIYRGVLGERMLRRIRYQLIALVMRFPLPHFKNVSQGEIVSIVTTETEPLGGFVGEAFSLPVFQGGTLLTILAFMFVQDWTLGLAAIALYPLQMYLIPKLQMSINQLGKQRVAAVRKLSERVGEVVSGVHEIHANDTSHYELADFSAHLGRIFELRYTIYRKKFFIKFLNNFLAQVTPFFFFSIGGYLVITNDLSFGALVATLGAYKDLSAPWKELLAYYQKMEDARIKYRQMAERFEPEGMLDENLQEPMESIATALQGPVVVSNLSLEEDGVKVVTAAAFRFDLSDHVAIIGGPGSGKSEIARLLARQLTPSGGSIAFGTANLAEIPEAVIGRQISYIDPEVYLSSGTIMENLCYVLKNYPRATGPATENTNPERESGRREAALSGNSLFDVDANWIDFNGLEIDSQSALMVEAVNALRAVGLEDEIFELGLRQIINPEKNTELTAGILQVRETFRQRLEDPKIADLVQVFELNSYNDNASVAENILFGTPTDATLKIESLGENAYVNEVLESTQLTETFLEMGLKIASLTVDLFRDLPPGHEFFERFSFIEEDALADFRRIKSLAASKGTDALDAADRRHLIDLPFKLIVTRHRLDLIDDNMKENLLKARRAFAAGLPQALSGAIEFFDASTYNSSGTILDNALFGKISSDRADSRTIVLDILTQIISDLGLRNAIIEAGLGYQVGIGGKRLTQLQRQKIGIARGILKKSQIMIVNDATALLAKPQQTAIMKAVKQMRDHAGLIWVTDDEEAGQDFDMVLNVVADRVSEGKGRSIGQADPSPSEEIDRTTEMDGEVGLFAGIPFFASLDRSSLKLLAFTSERQKLKPGEILFNQGDVGDAAYVVSEGNCNILVATTTGPVQVASSEAGDVVGELALLCDAPRTATVQAATDVVVLRVAKEVFLQLIQENAGISANLTKIIAGRLEKMMRGFTATNTTPIYYDVTGFPNKNLFFDRVEMARNIVTREKISFNVVIMDFGPVLESVLAPGTSLEKPVLQEIANRLKEVIRKSDSLARLSNASYGLVARNQAADIDAGALIRHIRERLQETIPVGEVQVNLAEKVTFDSYPLTAANTERAIEQIHARLKAS
ncbi:MAG: cyclic nucleotide-binding domain-containing protein [Rhodospirillales bacterium]|nr:cyclic nucleotide-binding domain-containing protein [Rhodospirillales bacterium]